MSYSVRDIFISYRREDGSVLTDSIATTLKSQGYSVFFDKEDIPKGNIFSERIEQAVKAAKEFIAIISPSYLGSNNEGVTRINDKSDWVRKELELALGRKDLHIFPVIINCNLPQKELLPPSLASLLNYNCYPYNSSYDTVEKILEAIKPEFHPETKENALIGAVAAGLRGVNLNDEEKFNEACKTISKLIENDTDCNILKKIVSKHENYSSNPFKDEYRFIVFYTLFSYYRRTHRYRELIKFVEAHIDEFNQYGFFEYVLTEYSVLKGKLSCSVEDRNTFMLTAIEKARNALCKLPNNDGIKHSYCVRIAEALESNLVLKDDLIEEAITLSSNLVKQKDNYARYHATYARLIAQRGRYDEALIHMGQAEILEEPGHEDWILRVAGYYKDELLIRQSQHFRK